MTTTTAGQEQVEWFGEKQLFKFIKNNEVHEVIAENLIDAVKKLRYILQVGENYSFEGHIVCSEPFFTDSGSKKLVRAIGFHIQTEEDSDAEDRIRPTRTC